MLLESKRKHRYQFLSFVLAILMVVSLLAPIESVQAAAPPIFAKEAQTILEGDTYTLSIKNKISNSNYSWKSSDQKVASVNKKGIVTGNKKGTAVISCTIEAGKKTYSLSCKITVKKPASDILIKNKIDYMLIGEAYDLNRTLKPKASNDITKWSSSDTTVIAPDRNGQFTAKKVGVATITATTMSKASDSVTIYVVEEEAKRITKDDVKDGKVQLKGKSYGNLTIDSNVGDVQVDLTDILVGGTLTMESGAAYSVATNNCTINKVAAVDHNQIASFALDDESDNPDKTPSLIAGSGSLIVTIDSECNISVKQSNGATIQSFSVITKQDGSIEIQLEGFKGDLVIDSTSQASIKIAATACEISSATVRNATEGQAITFTDPNAGTAQASTIQNVNMAANAALTVDIKADEVKVARDVSQANVVIQQPVTRLTNEGSSTSLLVNSQIGAITSTGRETQVSLGNNARVDNITVSGSNTNLEVQAGAQVSTVTTSADNARVNVAEGSTIQRVVTHGNSSQISGTGRIEEAVVTGNDVTIDTEVTTLKVAIGTNNVFVGGKEVKEEDKVAIATPTPAPTAAPTSRPTVTPRVTVTPTPKVTVTPTPKVTVTPVPTSGPVVPPYNPGQPPTQPESGDAKKLENYNKLLSELHTAMAKCVSQNNASNQNLAKVALNSLISQLKQGNDLEEQYANVELKNDDIYDYSEYIEHLIVYGQDFGAPIRTYYERVSNGQATLQMAVNCGNRIAFLVKRVNTEKAIILGGATAVFASLERSKEEFLVAMNQLLEDAGETSVLKQEEAEFYQSRVLQRVMDDDFIREYYQSPSSMSFLKGVICANNLIGFYDEVKAMFDHHASYLDLVDQVINALPEHRVVKWFNEYDKKIYFDHIVYDNSANKQEVVAALQNLFDTIDLRPYFGEEITVFTVNGNYAEVLIYDLLKNLCFFEQYPDGSYEPLYYYNKNKANLNNLELVDAIDRCMRAIVWTTHLIHEKCDNEANDNQVYLDKILLATETGDKESLYNAIAEFYSFKRNLPVAYMADSWWRQEAPFDEQGAPAIDKQSCLDFLKIKRQDTNSKLYQYIQNRQNINTELTNQALDDIIQAVSNSSLWMQQGRRLSDAVLDVMPEVKIHHWTDDDGNEHFDYAEYDPQENRAELLQAIQNLCNEVELSEFFGDSITELTIDPQAEDVVIRDVIRKAYTYGYYPDGGYEMLNYYRENRDVPGFIAEKQTIYECLASVLWSVRGKNEWNTYYLGRYQEVGDAIIAAVQDNDETALYNGLLELFHEKLTDDEGTKNEWNEYDKPNNEEGALIHKSYCLEILKSKLQPLSEEFEGVPTNSRLYNYIAKRDSAGVGAGAEDLDLAIYDIVDAVRESQLWFVTNYNEIKPMVDNLIKAVTEENETLAYATLSEIHTYLVDNYQVEGEIKGEEYAGAYLAALRNMMNNDPEQPLHIYHQIYLHMNEGDYSRYISETANNALWSAHWFLEGSEDAEENLRQEYEAYIRWKPVKDKLDSVLYKEGTDVEFLGNLQALLDIGKADNELVAIHFNQTPNLQLVTVDNRLITFYVAELQRRMSDDSMDSNEEKTEFWYRYGSYIYNQNKLELTTPNNEIIELTLVDIIRAILEVNDHWYPYELMNRVITALNNDDANQLYVLLSEIKDYLVINHNEEDVVLLPEQYKEVYLYQLRLRTLVDEDNELSYYNDLPNEYTADTAEAAWSALWCIKGYLDRNTANWYESMYSGVEEYRPLLDNVLNAVPAFAASVTSSAITGENFIEIIFNNPIDDNDRSEIVAALQALFDGVQHERFDTVPITVDAAYADTFIESLAYRMGNFEPDQNGFYNNIYLYYNNGQSFAPEKLKVMIYETVAEILWSTTDIQS